MNEYLRNEDLMNKCITVIMKNDIEITGYISSVGEKFFKLLDIECDNDIVIINSSEVSLLRINSKYKEVYKEVDEVYEEASDDDRFYNSIPPTGRHFTGRVIEPKGDGRPVDNDIEPAPKQYRPAIDTTNTYSMPGPKIDGLENGPYQGPKFVRSTRKEG